MFQTIEVSQALAEDGESTGPYTSPPRPMVEVVENLRDEISVLSVRGHAYGSRELSMVLVHLDEARLWAIEYGLKNGSHLLVDKRKYREGLEQTAHLAPRNARGEIGIDARNSYVPETQLTEPTE